MNAPDLRASDAERDAAVERLQAASRDGRLGADELEERVSAALTARTHGDLRAVLADLPADEARATPAPRMGDPERSLVLRRRFAGFLIPNLICLAVWAATGADRFWPIWVLLGTGIAFGAFAVRYALGVENEEEDQRESGLPQLPEPPRPPRR